MLMNDPIGDMLTRIRNAQLRKRPTVTTPASTMRARVLDVLQTEGYIRGYSEVELNGKAEFQIELKYFDGQPVIREIQRVSKPGRRVYSSVRNIRASRTDSACRSCRRPRASCRTTSAHAECRRRGALPRLLTLPAMRTGHRQCRELARSRCRCPRASRRNVEGQTVTGKGPKGSSRCSW
jgi:small subunit ribosomal protein S8